MSIIHTLGLKRIVGGRVIIRIIILILMSTFLCLFIAGVIGAIYVMILNIRFINLIKRLDSNKHYIIELGQKAYPDSKDTLEQMYVFRDLIRFSKESKAAFPTGIKELDNIHSKMNIIGKRVVVIVICLAVIFMGGFITFMIM